MMGDIQVLSIFDIDVKAKVDKLRKENETKGL